MLEIAIIVLILFTSLFTLPSSGTQNYTLRSVRTPSFGSIRSNPFMYGVNYLGKWHAYSSEFTTEEVLRRDFHMFKSSNMSVIAFSLYWNHLEGDRMGSYDGVRNNGIPYGDGFLDEVKRVCRIANEFGLKVLLTIHTSWGEAGSWNTPNYVIDPVTGENMGLAIIRSEDMKQAFLEMFTHVVRYMSDDTPFYSWALLNEPWYWPKRLDPPFDHIDQKESFIDLMLKQRNIVESFDPKRKTHIKFVSDHRWQTEDGVWLIKNSFEANWNWDERILQAVDFVGFNIYPPIWGKIDGGSERITDPEFIGKWKNITATNILWATQHGKEVWVTETGAFTGNSAKDEEQNMVDENQRVAVKYAVDFFKVLPINALIGWMWESDETNPDADFGYPGIRYNLCKDIYGNPRPAYFELTFFIRRS